MKLFRWLLGILTMPSRIWKASKRFWDLDQIYRANLSELQLNCMAGNYTKPQTAKLRAFLDKQIRELQGRRAALREAERLRTVSGIMKIDE